MFGFIESFYDYYYLVLVLQGICVFHSIRRGTQSKWIWIIVFLPLIGCLAYLFTEVVKKQHVFSVQSTVGAVVNPSGKIKNLEKEFTFSNTFANRVALADAYLQSGRYHEAIELYEPALTGMFHDNEHVIKALIQSYYQFERFDDILRLAPKISNSFDFSKSPANLVFAIALEKNGKFELAEQEYKKMNHRFSNYEARYSYGTFLLRANRKEDASGIFNEIIEEGQHMSRREKGNSKIWIDKAIQEWNKIMSAA